MAATPAQLAAWDAYLAVTVGMTPALQAHHAGEGAAINPCLARIVIRIRRYAPMWGTDGPILLAAAHSAVRLFYAGDSQALSDLLHAMSRRLYAISATSSQRRERGDQASHRYPPPALADRHRPQPSRNDTENDQEGLADD